DEVRSRLALCENEVIFNDEQIAPALQFEDPDALAKAVEPIRSFAEEEFKDADELVRVMRASVRKLILGAIENSVVAGDTNGALKWTLVLVSSGKPSETEKLAAENARALLAQSVS